MTSVDEAPSVRAVLDAEASYLLLTARRTLNFVKKAAEAGDEYHDLQPLQDLQCGYAAKLRFTMGPAGQLRPTVVVGRASVHHAIAFSPEGRMQVASEILGGPAHRLDDTSTTTDRETFCLKKDA